MIGILYIPINETKKSFLKKIDPIKYFPTNSIIFLYFVSGVQSQINEINCHNYPYRDSAQFIGVQIKMKDKDEFFFFFLDIFDAITSIALLNI